MNNNVIAPAPPTLHWAIVLALSVVTLGLFGYFWMFRQARFVKQIDPTSRAAYQVLVAAALFLFSILLTVVGMLTVARGVAAPDLGSVMNMMRFFQILMVITAYLQMRTSLTKQYGVKLNAFLAVIFNVYYLQYHLSQIARNQGLAVAGTVLASSQAGSVSA